MRFMNEFDVDFAERRYGDNPIVMQAIRTLRSLITAADENSDGWAFWPKPARSAAKLMELIEGNGTNEAIRTIGERATPDAYRKAIAPIKAFRTRSGINFQIYDEEGRAV